MSGVQDRHQYTPIITAFVYYDDQRKDSSVKVIFEILSYLASLSDGCSKCINAISHQYRNLPIIEYDIKSGKGVLIQVGITLSILEHFYFMYIRVSYKCK